MRSPVNDECHLRIAEAICATAYGPIFRCDVVNERGILWLFQRVENVGNEIVHVAEILAGRREPGKDPCRP